MAKEIDGIGKLSGAGQVSGGVEVDMLALEASDSTTSKLSLGLGGQVSLRADLDFVPFDLVGNVACPAFRDKAVRYDLTLPEQTVTIAFTTSGVLEPMGGETSGTLVLNIASEGSKVDLKGGPVLQRMLVDDPALLVECPAIPFVEAIRLTTGDALIGSDVAAQLGGRINDIEIPGMRFRVPLTPIP